MILIIFRSNITKNENKKRKNEEEKGGQEEENRSQQPSSAWINFTNDDYTATTQKNNNFSGPIFFKFLHKEEKEKEGKENVFCLTAQENGNLLWAPYEPPNDDDYEGGPYLPQQVFIAQSINSNAGKDNICCIFGFKSAVYKKYVGSDKIGSVSAETEAMGPQDMWTLEKISDNLKNVIAIKNYFNQKYLSVDTVKEDSKGNLMVRCDSEEIGGNETFQLMQFKNTNSFTSSTNNSTKDQKEDFEELLEIESESTKKYLGYGTVSFKTPVASSVIAAEQKKLKKAQEEGKLRETLLEKRIKSKADKFCY